MNLNLVVKCFIPWESAKILLVGIRGLAIDGNAALSLCSNLKMIISQFFKTTKN